MRRGRFKISRACPSRCCPPPSFVSILFPCFRNSGTRGYKYLELHLSVASETFFFDLLDKERSFVKSEKFRTVLEFVSDKGDKFSNLKFQWLRISRCDGYQK